MRGRCRATTGQARGWGVGVGVQGSCGAGMGVRGRRRVRGSCGAGTGPLLRLRTPPLGRIDSIPARHCPQNHPTTKRNANAHFASGTPGISSSASPAPLQGLERVPQLAGGHCTAGSALPRATGRGVAAQCPLVPEQNRGHLPGAGDSSPLPWQLWSPTTTATQSSREQGGGGGLVGLGGRWAVPR